MIKSGSKVALQYRLTYDDAQGELIEQTSEKEPLYYEHGAGQMLEAFEEKLQGLSAQDKFEFTLTPAQAYGPLHEQLITEYPKEDFIVEGELDEDFIQEGELLEMTDDEGNTFEGLIEENKTNTIIVNFNHPLAGEHLHFKGKVTKVS